jgi:signal transduction histidine kinase
VQHLTEALGGAGVGLSGGESAQQRLARLAGELNASLDSAVWSVQPDKDTLLNLADYLGDSFHELLAGTNIELELDFPDPVPAWPLSRSERYHLALAAVEALNNALKHSRASRVQLRLRLDTNSFTLQIADNGCGFTAESSKPETPNSKLTGGHGLANLRQRAERLGGVCRVISSPGHGTTIELSLSPAARRDRQTPARPMPPPA